MKSEPLVVEREPKREGSYHDTGSQAFHSRASQGIVSGLLPGESFPEGRRGHARDRENSIFGLLKAYRQDGDGFSVDYHRATPGRVSQEAEEQIEEDEDNPIRWTGESSANE